MRTNDKHPTSNAILGSAVLFLIPGLIYWSILGLQFDVNDWLRIGVCVFLATMAVWARYKPLAPAIVCVVVYPIMVGIQLVCGTPIGLVMGILVAATFLLLLIGLVSAVGKRSDQ